MKPRKAIWAERERERNQSERCLLILRRAAYLVGLLMLFSQCFLRHFQVINGRAKIMNCSISRRAFGVRLFELQNRISWKIHLRMDKQNLILSALKRLYTLKASLAGSSFLFRYDN
jgi:hypothetical protein